ncbi:MAG: hypothetical protein JWP27_1505 [Flaviaesturariibacter sp.]|nr:hypothetical protein [Flaviaesturariibacter sp.]
MKQMSRLLSTSLACLFFLLSCDKNGTGNDSSMKPLAYADSVLYRTAGSGDVFAKPLNEQAGSYTVFPEDGLDIDASSGAINVSRSESGLRYRVTYHAPSGQTSSTSVVISGVNYPDKYYRLSANDSLCRPVYNADAARALPAGSFDDGGTANSGGCSIRTSNGIINLAQSIRNGLFGAVPQNDVRKEVEINYRIADKSNSASNSIKVKLYYYETEADVPEDLKQTIRDHEAQLLATFASVPPANDATGRVARLQKPRPPCVVIIAH